MKCLGTLLWDVPDFLSKKQRENYCIIHFPPWRRKPNAQWASKVSGWRTFHIWEYYSNQNIEWMNGCQLNMNMFNKRPPLKCKVSCFLPTWSNRSYRICGGKRHHVEFIASLKRRSWCRLLECRIKACLLKSKITCFLKKQFLECYWAL